ncbi:uncharacterized protein [Antedon mediterranea]|uniref:uncharacterized protein isoform X2 n=1 Tax=Antedon mediterranea TaxID=105859 RepID=UPI003AF9A937
MMDIEKEHHCCSRISYHCFKCKKENTATPTKTKYNPTYDDTATYNVVESSTQRGHPKLVDSNGYSYVKRKTSSNSTYWRCSLRNKNITCKATVIQRSQCIPEFVFGSCFHIHLPNQGGRPKSSRVRRKNKAIRSTVDAMKSESEILMASDSVLIESSDVAIGSLLYSSYEQVANENVEIEVVTDVQATNVLEIQASSTDTIINNDNTIDNIDAPTNNNDNTIINAQTTNTESTVNNDAANNSKNASLESPNSSSVEESRPVTDEIATDEGVLTDEVADDTTLKFTIVEGGSQRAKNKLIDSEGYSYTVQRSNDNGCVTWRCSKRDKTLNCRVLVRQRKDTFVRNRKHEHPGNPGQKIKSAVVSDIKRKASQEMCTPVIDIVRQTLSEYVEAGTLSVLPSEGALKRQAKRFRLNCQKPEEPTDLDFTLANHAIPEGFLRADIVRGKQRHLLFASEEQLDVLARGKRWYIDVNSKMLKEPFTHLLTVHCFIQREIEIKQVPLCFAIMSNNMKHDYIGIFEMIKRILPREIKVQECFMDFVDNLWEAFSQVFPGVTARGCSYLWTQAIWFKIQEQGLVKAYLSKKKTHSRLRKLLALPYMPSDIIPELFLQLLEKVDHEKEDLMEVFTYVENTWISDNTVWPPQVWSVFGKSVRTNTDVEGWYRRLKVKERNSNVPLYKLIKVFYTELSLVGVKTSLIKEEKLMKHQRKTYKNLHGKLQEYWNDFRSGKKSADDLLNVCSHLYG